MLDIKAEWLEQAQNEGVVEVCPCQWILRTSDGFRFVWTAFGEIRDTKI